MFTPHTIVPITGFWQTKKTWQEASAHRWERRDEHERRGVFRQHCRAIDARPELEPELGLRAVAAPHSALQAREACEREREREGERERGGGYIAFWTADFSGRLSSCKLL